MRTMPAEVSPTNLVERLFVLIFMIFALSAFAVSVAQLTQAYFKISERSRNFNDEMFAVRIYLKNLKMEESVQDRIRGYLHHLFRRRRIMAKEEGLLGKLPAKLKLAVEHAKIMRNLCLLQMYEFLDTPTLERICDSSEIVDFLPSDVVSTSGEVASAAWILCSGELRIMNPEYGVDPKIMLVDEECLLKEGEEVSQYTVVAAASSEVLKIDKHKFWQLAGEHVRSSALGADGPDPASPISIAAATAGHSQHQDNQAASAASAVLS